MLTKILALAALALVASSSALAAVGGCHTVSGTFANQLNVPCVVPAIVCVQQQVMGDLSGVSTTLVTTVDPVAHTFSGTVTNALDNGAILTATIAGTIVNGVGHSVETITGGTRQFAHATGTIVVDGINGVGTYLGEYCLGDGGDGD